MATRKNLPTKTSKKSTLGKKKISGTGRPEAVGTMNFKQFGGAGGGKKTASKKSGLSPKSPAKSSKKRS